jgi:hypothetical protein
VHDEAMVREPIIYDIIDAVYKEFAGKCATPIKIIEHLKSAGLYASHSTLRNALEILIKLGKAEKHKLHKGYTLYCFGDMPEFRPELNYEEVEKCIMELMPSATLLQIAECALKAKVRGDYTAVYLSVLYVLLRMVKEGKIHYIIFVGDKRDRFKVIIQQ